MHSTLSGSGLLAIGGKIAQMNDIEKQILRDKVREKQNNQESQPDAVVITEKKKRKRKKKKKIDPQNEPFSIDSILVTESQIQRRERQANSLQNLVVVEEIVGESNSGGAKSRSSGSAAGGSAGDIISQEN